MLIGFVLINGLWDTVTTCIYDILILTETNLTPNINDNELGLTGFDIFLKDRSQLTSTKNSGGGVLVATKSHLRAKTLETSVDDVEYLFLTTSTGTSTI